MVCKVSRVFEQKYSSLAILTDAPSGGPGYILSRGAMRKLVHDDWNRATGEWLGSQLSRRYWVDMLTDCCGDSVSGSCVFTSPDSADCPGAWLGIA